EVAVHSIARASTKENLLALMVIVTLLIGEVFSESWMELLDHSFDNLTQLYTVEHPDRAELK
ncbi:MAG TPA: hypothetical protein HPP65_09045, partial [Gammaproteobacteria bacterium]|nr:hypothetical protein [Gammaproteobacteria bacterium]